MNSADEDERIWDLFNRVIDLGTQINENMWAGEEEPILGYAKKSNLISVDKRELYKKELEQLEEELYHYLFSLNRVEVRETPHQLDHVYNLQSLRKYYFALEDVWDDLKDEIIKHHIDEELIDRDLFLENYYSLDPPYVSKGTKIPLGIKKICHETRWCYVYQQYNATIVLTRTMIETILKGKLKYKFENIISIKKIINEAKNKNIITYNTAQEAQKIRCLANNILHQGITVEEKDAKRVLEFTLRFLEEVYFE